MTISIQITHGGPHGTVAVHHGSAQVMDDNMEVIREGKEFVPGVTTYTLSPLQSLLLHVWDGQEIVVREAQGAPEAITATPEPPAPAESA